MDSACAEALTSTEVGDRFGLQSLPKLPEFHFSVANGSLANPSLELELIEPPVLCQRQVLG